MQGVPFTDGAGIVGGVVADFVDLLVAISYSLLVRTEKMRN